MSTALTLLLAVFIPWALLICRNNVNPHGYDEYGVAQHPIHRAEKNQQEE